MGIASIIISVISLIISIIFAIIVYKQTKHNNLKAEIREYLKLGIENVNSKIEKINSSNNHPNVFYVYLTWIMNDISIFNHSKTIKMDNFQETTIIHLEDVFTGYLNHLKHLTELLKNINYKLEEKQNIIQIYIDDINEQLEFFAKNHNDFLIALKKERKEFEYFCDTNLKIREILIEMKIIEER